MTNRIHERTSVAMLMGAAVFDAAGKPFGSVREFAVDPLGDVHTVESLVVRRASEWEWKWGGGKLPVLVRVAELKLDSACCRIELSANAMPVEMAGPLAEDQTYLLLERDLLDQQIIDVHGHKVVRVNDVDLVWIPAGETSESRLALRIAEVEVGTRGAVRRLLKGLPKTAVMRAASRFPPSVIPWEFVDLIDRDPARRVKLKIEQDKLARMHPSDIADILEDLAPAERQALFNSLDEEVAAEALEEVDPKMQQALIASMGSEQIAGIVEEMDPGAAADLLGELSDEQSDAILDEMGEEERQEVEELLEFPSDSAAGRMTTEYVALPTEAAVVDAIVALRGFEGDLETVTDVYLTDAAGKITHVVPLVKLLLARGGDLLKELSDSHVVCCRTDAPGKKVAELFDKYNLRSLPVVDGERRLAGVIHAEQVIALLRGKR